MSRLAISFVAVLFLFGVLACSKDDSKGSEPKARVIGQSEKPGHLPDGTRVQELSDAEVKQITSSFEGVAQVVGALGEVMQKTEGRPTFGSKSLKTQGLSGGLSEMSPLAFMVQSNLRAIAKKASRPGYSDELKQDMRSKCQIIPMDVKTETSGGRNGNTISGQMTMKGQGRTVGSVCPVVSGSSVSGQAAFSGTVNSADEVQTMNMNGQVTFVGEAEAQDAVSEQTGFKRAAVRGTMSGSVSQNQTSGQARGEVDASAAIETLDFGKLDGRVVAEFNVTGSGAAQGSDVRGTFKLVVILTEGGRTLLIQVFANIKSQTETQVEVYINGKKVEPENLPLK